MKVTCDAVEGAKGTFAPSTTGAICVLLWSLPELYRSIFTNGDDPGSVR